MTNLYKNRANKFTSRRQQDIQDQCQAYMTSRYQELFIVYVLCTQIIVLCNLATYISASILIKIFLICIDICIGYIFRLKNKCLFWRDDIVEL